MIKAHISILLGIILLPGFSWAQCKDWNWPTDKEKAQEQIAILQDAVRSEQYKQAEPPLFWLLSNAPNLNVSIYIRGAEVFDRLAKEEVDPDRKATYVDSLMLIYDRRIQNCGELETVLNRKAIAFFKYHINGPEPGKVLNLLDSVIKLNGDKTMDVTLVPYMEAIAVTQLKQKTLSQKEILRRYDEIIRIVDDKIKSAKDDKGRVEKLNNYKSEIDELLLKIVKIDCDFVDNVLGPKYRKNPNDVSMAKRIFGYLLTDKCIDDPLWLETGEFIFSKEKDFGLGKNLGLQFYADKNYEKAQFYFDESLKLAPNGRDSAEVFTYQGSLSAKKGNNHEARDAYRRAIQVDRKNTEAYNKIGDLYYNSFNDCANKVSMADDRMVYLIAYDYYHKAGNQEKMMTARKSFPSREEIFLMNYQAGQTVHVNCWIDESTVIRTRD